MLSGKYFVDEAYDRVHRAAAVLDLGPRLPEARRPGAHRRLAARPRRARAPHGRRASPASRTASCTSTRCSCSSGSSPRSPGAGAMSDAALLNVVLFLPGRGHPRDHRAAGAGRRRRAAPVARRDGAAVRADRAPLRPVRSGRGRPAIRDPPALDRVLGRLLPDRPRRLQRAAGPADRVPRPAGRVGSVHRHREGREALLRDGVRAAVRDGRHVRRAGPVPVLPVLGGDADPALPHHRHLGRRAADLRDAQVRALHRVRQHPDARRGDLPRVLARDDVGSDVVRLRRPLSRGAAAAGADGAPRRLRAVLRDQGAHRPAPHVAPRRARRGAHGGLGDPRRRPAEDGDVRLHEARLSAVPGCDPALRARSSARWRS